MEEVDVQVRLYIEVAAQLGLKLAELEAWRDNLAEDVDEHSDVASIFQHVDVAITSLKAAQQELRALAQSAGAC